MVGMVYLFTKELYKFCDAHLMNQLRFCGAKIHSDPFL